MERFIYEHPLLCLAGFLILVCALGVWAGAWIALRGTSRVDGMDFIDRLDGAHGVAIVIVRRRGPLPEEQRAKILAQWEEDCPKRMAIEDLVDDLLFEAQHQAAEAQLSVSPGATSHALGGVAWLSELLQRMPGNKAGHWVRRPLPPSERKGAA